MSIDPTNLFTEIYRTSCCLSIKFDVLQFQSKINEKSQHRVDEQQHKSLSDSANEHSNSDDRDYGKSESVESRLLNTNNKSGRR